MIRSAESEPVTFQLFAANAGECNPYWAGYYRVGKRTVRIAQIFSEVYGPGYGLVGMRPRRELEAFIAAARS